METNDYLTQIFHVLNRRLSARDVSFTEENVLFIRDDAVEYGTEKRWVHQERLVTAEQFSDAFAPLLTDGPSWIHANAIPFSDDRFLITVAAGRKIGNPQPSINVSYEPEKRAEIILTKALVTAN